MSIKKQSKLPDRSTRHKYDEAINVAYEYMEMGCEPRSALKQAGNDLGIPYGDEMEKFVAYAESKIF